MSPEQFSKQHVLQNLGKVFFALNDAGWSNSAFESISSRLEKADVVAQSYGWAPAPEASQSEDDDEDVVTFVTRSGQTSTAETWEQLCEDERIELSTESANEYYLVSWELGQRLKKAGELVSDDILGMVVWARYGMGQAVWRDSVIAEIAAQE
ncbi:hypothetical protein RYA05_02135 [Pseudomonas syringae pv. actinidiae]|nr:hypothetical protein [Pseudomonas syringae pv. actinidiae]